MRYQLKRTSVEALQYTGQTLEVIRAWLSEHVVDHTFVFENRDGISVGSRSIHRRLYLDYWLCVPPDGNLVVLHDIAFNERYEKSHESIDVAPENIRYFYASLGWKPFCDWYRSVLSVDVVNLRCTHNQDSYSVFASDEFGGRAVEFQSNQVIIWDGNSFSLESPKEFVKNHGVFLETLTDPTFRTFPREY